MIDNLTFSHYLERTGSAFTGAFGHFSTSDATKRPELDERAS
ncbi:hypothetical protein [Coleofasciculus sp. FACHB-712]|nr:hypothetical protein [Coleofasciculus sp. FACHB-712]